MFDFLPAQQFVVPVWALWVAALLGILMMVVQILYQWFHDQPEASRFFDYGVQATHRQSSLTRHPNGLLQEIPCGWTYPQNKDTYIHIHVGELCKGPPKNQNTRGTPKRQAFEAAGRTGCRVHAPCSHRQKKSSGARPSPIKCRNLSDPESFWTIMGVGGGGGR